jgi:cytochrome b6-f complex iron-sulfur subunit
VSEPVSLDRVARLDAYLDALAGPARPASHARDADELAARLLAAQLRVACTGAAPTEPFLQALEQRVGEAIAGARPGRRGVSRRAFVRNAVAVAAGGAGAAAALGELGAGAPHALVAAGAGRWYDVAAVEEVPPGGAKAFTAGGVEGYLLNRGGALRAVSGICTHMGCRVKPDGDGLRCLCHDSRFDAAGRVVAGLAPRPLPEVDLRVARGRVYARGTREEA